MGSSPVADRKRISGLGTGDGEPRSMAFSELAIREILPRTIIQLNGAAQAEALNVALDRVGLSEGSPEPGFAVVGDGAVALWNGPGMWMMVVQRERPDLVSELNDALAGTGATATDLSHSRTVLRVSGPNTLDFLATGCSMDLERCKSNTSVSTQFGHFNVLMHLVDKETADLYVYRSFGQALWEHCHHAGLEFA